MERCLGDKGEKPSIHTKEAGLFPEANKVSAKAFRQAAGTQNQGKFVFVFVAFNKIDLKACTLTGRKRQREYR